jgi:D-inositol-3-phosphate glycosyltransferase
LPRKEIIVMDKHPVALPDLTSSRIASETPLTLLTGGGDKPYVYGITTALSAKGAAIDLIGSDELDCPEYHCARGVTFLNLRGDQRPEVSFARKVYRVSLYYARLIRYAWKAKPEIFHILWNNKIEPFDRTLLMFYYKWLGKRVVLTAHNVNTGRRDCTDTVFNRFTLRTQYRLTDHVFVHTQRMKQELMAELGVSEKRVTVIPFGINNSAPNTDLTSHEARRRLGIRDREKAILFFGRIAPYKGLEYLAEAFRQIVSRYHDYRLIIAGRPKNCEEYWGAIQKTLSHEIQSGRVLLYPHNIPDEEIEVYFKAADLFVLPYRHIYQSGVLFLGQRFGLPVVAADVGSLKDEIVEGKTGFVVTPEDPVDLARAVEQYFESDLYRSLSARRREIREYAEKHHSWDEVAQITMRVYTTLLWLPGPG